MSADPRDQRHDRTAPIDREWEHAGVSGRLRFVGEEQVANFRGTGMWINAKRFRLEPAGAGSSGPDLLAELLGDDQYHDDYAGGPQKRHWQHGPYRLTAIDVTSFVRTGPGDAAAVIRRWLVENITEPSADDLAVVDTRVVPILEGAEIYQLMPLGGAAWHDWGQVVGGSGFHEFIAVNRSTRFLTLLVATDD